ncbi:hypothetical protein VaNZ11_000941, partial [Volvox africanus]
GEFTLFCDTAPVTLTSLVLQALDMPSTLQGTFYTYRPIRRLGQGAFGEVSLASVLETGDVVALKRIHIRNTTGIPDVVVREIKALQSVSHPNVVALLDVFPKGQAIYLVQEYCTTDLAALLRRLPAPPPESVAKGLMLQLCRGLEALHAEGLMHRDVKPSNTLLSASAGAAKLADCGLARPLDGGERPAYTHAVATRWYRAPELLYGARAYGSAVDIWALGLVFAELLGLAPLIPGDNDIDQLGRVISTLGSMEPVWPGVRELPDWGKIAFPHAEPVPLAQLLPGASVPALNFLARFLRWVRVIKRSAKSRLTRAHRSNFTTFRIGGKVTNVTRHQSSFFAARFRCVGCVARDLSQMGTAPGPVKLSSCIVHYWPPCMGRDTNHEIWGTDLGPGMTGERPRTRISALVRTTGSLGGSVQDRSSIPLQDH